MEGSDVGRSLFSVFGIVDPRARRCSSVRSSPAFTWVAVLLGVPATVLLLIQAVTQDDALLPYSSALEAVLYFYAAYALISVHARGPRDHARRAVRGRRHLHARGLGHSPTCSPSTRRSSRQLHRRGATPAATAPGWSSLFLSFTTLSSTGLRRRHPDHAVRRARIVMIEQVAGVAYIAMVRLAPRRHSWCWARRACAGASLPGER